MALSFELRCYTAICHATSNSIKAVFLVWISWKKLHNLKDETLFLKSNWKLDVSNEIPLMQWFKTMLYLFGTHAYRTERPVPKICSTNTCTITCMCWNTFATIKKCNVMLQSLIFFSRVITKQCKHGQKCNHLHQAMMSHGNQKFLWLLHN